MSEEKQRYDNVDQEVDKITEGSNLSMIIVPDAVKDAVAYKKYHKLKNSAALTHPTRLIQTSDPNLVIDPIGHIRYLDKKINHLPSDEQDLITKRYKAIKVIWLRVGALKKKAYGLKSPRYRGSLQMGLLDERQSEVIEYFGRMLKPAEVHKIVTLDWGYEVSIEVIRKFKKKYLDKIKDRQAHFQKDFSSLRLSHKKGRLEELVFMYNSRKTIYDVTHTKTDYELMLKTLRAIRDEVEDKSLRIEHNINAKLEITVNNHIQQEIMKDLTINDIIVARVASRMNVNPRFLISRLHNSYYAQHSGFIRPTEDSPEIQYPSTIVYNWNVIEAQHKQHGDTGLDDAEWEEVEPTKEKAAQDLKAMLLAKIGNKKDALSTAKQRIEKNS